MTTDTMIALAYAIGALSGVILGCILTAMLLYRERVKVEEQDEQIHVDGAWPVRREVP